MQNIVNYQTPLFSLLPKEIVENIFCRLGFSLRKMKMVDNETKNFIENKQPFNRINIASHLLRESFKIFPLLQKNDVDKALAKMINVIVIDDRIKALNMTEFIDNPKIYSSTLSQITSAFAEAEDDPEYAITIADCAENIEDKAKALIEIAKKVSDKKTALDITISVHKMLFNPTKILGSSSLLSEVLHLLITLDVEKGKALIQRSQSTAMLQAERSDRVTAMIAITDSLTSIDQETAKKCMVIALRENKYVSDRKVKYQNMVSIAKVLQKLNDPKALEVLETALLETKDCYYHDEIFSSASEILALIQSHDSLPLITKALEILHLNESSLNTFRMISKFLMILAPIDPDKTLKLTHDALDTVMTDLTDVELIESMAILLNVMLMVDVDEAIKIGESALCNVDYMKLGLQKAQSYFALSKFFAKINPERGIEIAETAVSISNSLKFQSPIIANIGKFIVQHNFERAVEVVKYVKDPSNRCDALIALALEFFQNHKV